MSDEREPLPPVDPFLSDDPAALERERRRQQREAKRRQRAGRKSLGERVSGVLDEAAGKGRDAVEQTKERARGREIPADAPEPPAFRSPRAAPPRDGSDAPAAPPEPTRYSAEELMPRRRTRSQPAVSPQRPAPAPPTGEHDRLGEAEGAPPPPVPPERREVATGDYPPLPPPAEPPAGDRRTIWIRRLIALAVLLLIAVGAYALLSSGGGSEPAQQGPATLKTQEVTIPEGYTRSQIGEVAKDAGLQGDYEKATARAPKGFDIAKTGAPKDASLEGFLFPATYELEKGASVEDLVEDQLAAFDDNIDQVDMKAAEKKNLTIYDVVTIASMIEREVMVPKERPLVAAVIYNRLAQGIPLGIDATLRYELDNFEEPLTESDLATESPYNTRLVTGLPPTPIANPGLDSLQAAADPAGVDYLYYVVKPGTCGKHYFTNDYDDFLAASEKYDSAREAEGGSPTDC
jgi:cell division protein YceG involved in septum cleavage